MKIEKLSWFSEVLLGHFFKICDIIGAFDSIF